MTTKRKVILVTDGDIYAAKTIEYAAAQVEGAAFRNQRAILRSGAGLN